jgi:RNA polymerase sigma factor (sigma-70 family)
MSDYSDPALRSYLQQISKHPLLTADEEIELARRIVAAKDFLKVDKSLLTKEQAAIARDGKKARDRFIKANLLLVVRFVKRFGYRRQSLSLLDLIQEGNIGLHRAVDKFDPSKGYKFSTYAFWWVRQACQRAVHQDDAMISLPLSHYDMVSRVTRARDELMGRLGREATWAELAAHLGADEEEMRSILRRSQFVNSFDQPLPGDSGIASRLDLIEDPSSALDLGAICDTITAAKLNTYLRENLDERARDILVSRHSDAPTSWQDLSKRWNAPKDLLQRVERSAAAQCRQFLDGSGESQCPARAGVGKQQDLLDLLLPC